MKIARYRCKGEECYGVIDQQKVLCLPALAKRLKKELPRRLEDFIAEETALKTAETLLSKAKPSDIENVSAPLNEVQLLAPLAFPPKIICLGRNYVDHSAEMKSYRSG